MSTETQRADAVLNCAPLQMAVVVATQETIVAGIAGRTLAQLQADAALYERFGLHASAQALRERALGMRALGGGGQFGGGTTTRQTAEVRPPCLQGGLRQDAM